MQNIIRKNAYYYFIDCLLVKKFKTNNERSFCNFINVLLRKNLKIISKNATL